MYAREMQLTATRLRQFQAMIRGFYATQGRKDLPWRQPEADGNFDPYKILVSELMLQQTQVGRVIPKYRAFLAQFPTLDTLAAAPLGAVLRSWQGLGYNRRAKYLWQTAQQLAGRSSFPVVLGELVKLPGIGINTAGAILVYAFNQPMVFVETNVRTVYIHHFFSGRSDIDDKEIIALVRQTLEQGNPREFYWALMDYGTYLKAAVGNPNRASKHYVRQSRFHGSRRQLRGQVLRELASSRRTRGELHAAIADDRLPGILDGLITEGLILRKGTGYSLE